MSLNQSSQEPILSKIDLAKHFMHAMETAHFEEVKELAADNFIFEDSGGSKFDIEYFIHVHAPLITACQPWTFGMSNFKEFENTVFSVSQIKAKHTKDLVHPMLGITIPVTYIDVNLPKMSVDFTIQNNKITYLKVTAPKGGGLGGLLHQIGLQKSSIQHPKSTS